VGSVLALLLDHYPRVETRRPQRPSDWILSELYFDKTAAAVWATSMSLAPAPLTATAPTFSPPI